MMKLLAVLLLATFAPLAHAALENPVLRLGLDVEPATLDWNEYRSDNERFLMSFLMRGMLKYDARNQPVCDLCRSFAVSPDGLTYTFEVNVDESWSDGVKLEAAHFADSFHRLLAAGGRVRAAAAFRVISAVKAEGKGTLKIMLSEAFPLFTHLLTTVASFPIRKELLKTGDRGETHATSAVLGPYLLAAWEHGKRIVIEGNPKFAGTRPVYRVDFIIGRHGDQFGRFKAGRIDILPQPTTEDLMKLPGRKLEVSPYWAVRNLIFNARHPLLKKVDLRRAVLLALERDSLPSYLKNGERRATGLIPPGLPGARELPLVTANAAQALSDRERAAPGKDWIELSLLVPDSETERKVGQWLKEQLEKIRIRVKVQAKAVPTAFYRDLDSGKFDLALQTWSYDIASPVELLRSLQTNAALNRGHWTNVAFDAQVNQLLHAQNAGQSAALLDQATQLAEVQEVAIIPLGYPTQPFLLGRRVVSFAITPFGDPDLVKIQLRQ